MSLIKKLLPRTLLGRSLMILITPVLLIQAIATYIFFDRHWTKMTMRLAFSAAGEISMMADAIEDDPKATSDHLPDVVGYAVRYLDLLATYEKGATLQSEGLNHYKDVWKSHMAQTLEGELDETIHRPFVVSPDEDEKWVQVNVQLKNGVLMVLLPERRLFSSSGYIFLLWMIGSSTILLGVAIVFMRNQIRPIRKLAAAAERFGKGRDVAFFKPEGAKEVRQAGEAFLDMHKRIKRQIEQRTTMLAGVSHDLRTPLTRLKLETAMLENGNDVEAMKGDIQEMERMIGGYLDFVRGDGDEQETETSLGGLIDKLKDDARRQGLSLSTDVPQDVALMLRPMAFERALMNIVTNAGKYAKRIWLSTRVDGKKYVFINIDDDGPGIPEDKYEEVFRPFYRVDQSRNATTGGVGLGLPIAMDIVHTHGGKIWLEKSGRGGLRVVIRLPI